MQDLQDGSIFHPVKPKALISEGRNLFFFFFPKKKEIKKKRFTFVVSRKVSDKEDMVFLQSSKSM